MKWSVARFGIVLIRMSVKCALASLTNGNFKELCMTKIDVDYWDDPGDQYVVILNEDGAALKFDGKLKLWWRPF